MVGLSNGEKHFIRGGIEQDLRSDGRRRLHYRPISIETGVIPQANGSARVRIGSTDVIVSVKAELGKPSMSQPDKGKIAFFLECSPTAAPMFEGRGGEELSMELSSALRRCLLGGKSGTGRSFNDRKYKFLAALSNTGIPKVEVTYDASTDDQPEVDISDEDFSHLDTSGIPVIVTLTKVGRHYIVDATSEEESQMSSAVSVSVNRHGQICGFTKRGGAGLDPSVILDMISVAKHVGEELISVLDSEICAAESRASSAQ
ncbi:unnamed protein product [Victoria cruziana]